MTTTNMLGTFLCLFVTFSQGLAHASTEEAPDGHRCGVCPTYFQKICAFDVISNSTFIFDNHCIMDMYNCLNNAAFYAMPFDNCLYFGNFAYVHGYKYADRDYGEDNVLMKGSKKNPDFVK